MYSSLEFKLCYLKNQKLFSTRVKELFEPIVFALFKSILLRNRYLSNVRWVYNKKCKIWKGVLYLTENQLGRNKIWCAEDHHSYMCHICAKGFLDVNFNLAVIDKISIFHEIALNFTYSQKIIILDSVIGTFWTNCFYSINFLVGTCKQYTFSFLPVVSY